MLGPLGAFLTALLTSAVGAIVIPVVGIALVIAGAVMALGNHQRGKEGVMCALIGGAIMLLSMTLATGLGGAVPHG